METTWLDTLSRLRSLPQASREGAPMRLLHHLVPRLRQQDADWEQSGQQQIDVMLSLTECKLRLSTNPHLAALDAEVRARRAGRDDPE